ncbi:MAG: hypothetical protein ABIF17_03165 [Patescibacteria group bacterium]
MPEKEIRPSPGEVWRKQFRDGNDLVADEAHCFIIKDGEVLKKVWFGVNWKSKSVVDDMIDGQNDWKRVCTPPDISVIAPLYSLR